jgi:hypothetical protein
LKPDESFRLTLYYQILSYEIENVLYTYLAPYTVWFLQNFTPTVCRTKPFLFTAASLGSHYPLTTAPFNKITESPAMLPRKPRKLQILGKFTKARVYKPDTPRDVSGTKFCGFDLPNIGFCCTCAV